MSKLVLVVEDDIDVQDEIRLLLEGHGYTVYTANDGQEALDLINRLDVNFNMIISDLAMPVMNGYQLLQSIRSTAAWSGIPFIFLSGYSAPQNIRTARELGNDDYVIKPFDPADFLNIIETKINRFQQIQVAAETRLNDSRRALVYLIAHELRTPLTYISGGFSLLDEELNHSESELITSSLELIGSGTLRMSRIVDQATLYSELASGHIDLQIEAVGAVCEVANIVKNAIGNFVPMAENRDQSLVFKPLVNEVLFTFGISILIEQALGELIRNALTYSAEGSQTVIQLSRQEHWAIIRVIDHGRGMPPDVVDQVWNIFTQHQRKDYEQQGAGIGLSIARMIIEAHEGNIRLESVVNQGTMVTIALPLNGS